jgi:hypothetical protein
MAECPRILGYIRFKGLPLDSSVKLKNKLVSGLIFQGLPNTIIQIS